MSPTPQQRASEAPELEAFGTVADARSALAATLGQLALFLLFLSLLAGRFTLDRLCPHLPATDLRFVALAVTIIMCAIWLLPSPMAILNVRLPIGPILLSVWCAWMMITAAWSPRNSRTTENIIDLCFLMIFILLYWIVANILGPDQRDRMWKWFFITGIAYFVAAFVSGPDVQGRYSAFGGGPNVFVRVMVLATVAACYLAFVRLRSRYVFALPLFAVGALLSGSRGGMLSGVVIGLLICVLAVRKIGAIRAFFAFCGIVSAVYLTDRIFGGQIRRVFSERIIKQTLENRYTSGREDIYQTLIELFSESPIMGVGLDGFYGSQVAGVRYEYPHNLLLGTLTEGGLIGAVLLVAAVLASLPRLQSVRSSPAVVFPLIGASGLIVASMFSGDYYDSRWIWVLLSWAVIQADELDLNSERCIPACEHASTARQKCTEKESG